MQHSFSILQVLHHLAKFPTHGLPPSLISWIGSSLSECTMTYCSALSQFWCASGFYLCHHFLLCAATSNNTHSYANNSTLNCYPAFPNQTLSIHNLNIMHQTCIDSRMATLKAKHSNLTYAKKTLLHRIISPRHEYHSAWALTVVLNIGPHFHWGSLLVKVDP